MKPSHTTLTIPLPPLDTESMILLRHFIQSLLLEFDRQHFGQLQAYYHSPDLDEMIPF